MFGKIIRYFRSGRFRKVKRLIRSKSFLGSILFASALWGYTSLNHDYTTFVIVPLTVKLPADKAIENLLPDNISLKVKGGGWQLFYLEFFNSSKQCFIDLSDKSMPDYQYIISRSDILKSIQNIVDVESIDVLPETIGLQIGKIGRYKVPVNPIVNIKPRDGFIAMNEIKVSPDSIEITGNDIIVKNIKFWNTKKTEITDLCQNTTVPIELSDSLKTIVKISQNVVQISVKLQQAADITIYDIPIRIKGGSLPKNHRLVPTTIKVTVHGGVDMLSNLTPDDFISYIDYKDLIEDSTGIIKPKIQVSDSISKYFIRPRFIYHYKELKEIQ
jgi:YbbR domain-containing protein